MATENRRKSVVIVGAGFGGLYCAKKLTNQPVDITLIDRRNFHLFQPLLYQVASGSLSSGDIAVPIRTEFVDEKNVTVLQGEVDGFDVAQQLVHISGRQPVKYDFLVVATGSHHHYFGNEHWEENAPGLKTIEDALEIRGRILHAFEAAESELDEQKRRGWLTFVIVGGGPTGVELAGTIGELAHQTMKGEFRHIDLQSTRVILVENSDRILTPYHPESSSKATEFLAKLGVEVVLNTQVTNVLSGNVELTSQGNVQRVGAETVLWAAGNKASVLGQLVAEQTKAEVDRAGRVMVSNHLTIPNHDNIFVIGDLAHVKASDGKTVPGVAPAAMQQGKYVAQNIKAMIRGQVPKPFRYFDKGSLAVVGRNKAIAERGNMRFAGFFAWLIWAFIHVAYLVEFQNRAVVMFRWGVNYLSRKRGARLITGEGLPKPKVAEPSGDHPGVAVTGDKARI